MSNSKGNRDDDAVELPQRRDHDAKDHAVATTVRHALSDSDAWTDSQLHHVAQAARRRAERYRRARLVRTPAVLLASAAAAAALVVVVPQVLPAFGGGGQGPASPTPPSGSPSEQAALLTQEEVHRLFPGAEPAGYGSNPETAPAVPVDACGTAPLEAVSAPTTSEVARWGTSTSSAGTQIDLEVTVDAFPDAAQASGYADALSRSIHICAPAGGAQQPTYPFSTMAWIAPALYVTGYTDGVLVVTAVEVDGAHAATVRAWVPVAEDPQTLTTDPDQAVAPVPGADRAALGAAVRAVVDLAASAAKRAADA